MTNSLTQHVQTTDTNDFIIAVEFLGDTPFFALADGSIFYNETKHQLHEGGILIASSNGKTLYTGGDDGKIIATSQDGLSITITHEKNRWIDALTCSNDCLAWSYMLALEHYMPSASWILIKRNDRLFSSGVRTHSVVYFSRKTFSKMTNFFGSSV